MNGQNITKRSLAHLEESIKSKKAKIANISQNLKLSKKKLQNLNQQIEILEKTLRDEEKNLEYLETSYLKDRQSLESQVDSTPRRKIPNLLPFVEENKDKFQEESLEIVNNVAIKYNIETIDELLGTIPSSLRK